MAKKVKVGIHLNAFDGVSKVLNGVSKSFNKVTGSVMKATNRFQSFQRRTEKLRKSLKKVGSSIKSTGSYLSTRLTLPIVGLGAAIIKTAATFEASMNKVRALGKEAGGKTFKDLAAQAKELGASTKFSASQAADAMAILAQKGFDTTKTFQAMPGLLSLAAASGSDLAQAADVAASTMGAFGLKAKDMGRIADTMAAATAGSAVDLTSLQETLKFAAPVARQFGASMSDTIAATGLLGNVGITGTNAGTALKNAFLNLASPTAKASKFLEKLGVRVATDSGKMRRFQDIMADLGGTLGKLPQKAKLMVLKEVFGKIGIAGGATLQQLAKTGNLQKFSKAMQNVDGAAGKMAEIMQEGAAGAMVSLQSALEGLAIAIADSGILQWFTNLIKRITLFVRNLTKTNPEILKWGFIIAGAAAAIGPLLLMIGGFISLVPAIVSGAGMIGAAFTLLTGPVGLIIAAIAALVAGIVWLIFNWDVAKKFMIETWEKLDKFFNTKTGKILRILFPFINVPLLVIRNWDKIVPFFKTVWKAIKQVFMDHINLIMKMMDKMLDFVKWAIPDFVKEDLKTLGINIEGTPGGDRKRVAPSFGEEKTVGAMQSKIEKKSEVTLTLKGFPTGTEIEQSKGDADLLTVNTGFQGAY